MSEEEKAKIVLTQDQVLEILDSLIRTLEKERGVYTRQNLSYTIRLKDFGEQLTKLMTSVVVTTVENETVVITEGSKH